jgi:hypothetical protein
MILLKVAALGGVFLALLSIYPGVSVDLIFLLVLLFPIWLPVSLVAAFLLPVVRARLARKKSLDLELTGEGIGPGKGPIHRPRGVVLAVLILVLSFASILTGTPRRAALLLSRPAFQRYIATAPATANEGEPLNRFLGVYHVDRYAAAPRGGVYFRTHAGPDGIGPDTMSYGFAYKPNRQGTPFGRADYRLSRIVGDWYAFMASNDY